MYVFKWRMIFISIYLSYLCISFTSYCVHTPLEIKPIDSSLSSISYLPTFEGGAFARNQVDLKVIYACLSLKMENERFLQLSQGDKVYRINIKTEYFNIIGSVKSLSFIPPRKVSG